MNMILNQDSSAYMNEDSLYRDVTWLTDGEESTIRNVPYYGI
ncbi:hypothetical protein [Neobacillus sp. LXY-4]